MVQSYVEVKTLDDTAVRIKTIGLIHMERKLTQKRYLLKARSHCAICACDLFLVLMGCIRAGDVVSIAHCGH